MRFSGLLRHRRKMVPFRPLAAVLLASFTLGCLPGSLSVALKDAGRSLLAPGQQLAQSLLACLGSWVRAWEYRRDAARELRELRELVERLHDQNTALQARLRQPAGHAEVFFAEQPASLLSVRAVEARVLGERAQAFLRSTAIVSPRQPTEVTAGSLAVDFGPAVIDQGENALLTAGDVALAGGRIWGKLIEVGPQTAVVRRIDSPGYRGLAQIAHPADGVWKPLARGIVEGAGDGLCRIRMVDATAPVSVGDMVLAGEEHGLVDSALIYGRIERAELAPGAPHWQIWMEPAIAPQPPLRLTVLQPVINQARK
ncbi:MAG TPA: rod shape-determining protein MreC [Pirellulales bacterium]|jgi:cell shape-determining protein MreC|nr:rod shape-determining protein MreC [Pirellulales bacterium]